MTHWTGTRSGFNQRGNQVWLQQREQIRELNIEYHPDSRHYELLAQQEQRKLMAFLGDDYELWAEMVWPGNTIDERTWQEIYETTKGYFETKEHIWEMLSCSCNGVQELCRVCKAQARLGRKEE